MIVSKTTFLASLFSMLGFGCGLLAANAGLVLVLALLFKWLWNAALPSLVNVPRISYVQASELLGLALVMRIVLRGVKLKFRARL